jgi:hypothetical protein
MTQRNERPENCCRSIHGDSVEFTGVRSKAKEAALSAASFGGIVE